MTTPAPVASASQPRPGAETAGQPAAIPTPSSAAQTPPEATPAPGSGLRGQISQVLASLRSDLEGTPGRMRGLAVLVVVVGLAFGLGAGQAFRSADGALRRAGANTDQLVRIQAIQTNVIQADADATNAFLVGGLEPPAQRADYTTSVANASRLIAEAAQSQPADGRALGALNQALIDYTSEIEQARANNRQALPIGAQYLRDASTTLRSQALPLLKNLVDANNRRVAEEFDNAGRASLWLIISGVLALAVLGLSLVWLARRTRRYVNLPLAVAALLVLVTLGAGAAGLFGVAGQVHSVRDGAYAATLSTAKARIAAFDAKSNESLTLIARGSGASFEKAWQGSASAITAELASLGRNPASSDLRGLPWNAYASVHKQIRALDDGGNWDRAVQQATGTAPGTGNAAFVAFNTASAAQLSSLSGQTASELDDAGGWLPFAGVLGILAGIAAAACAWWGIALRLEEYR